MQQQLCEEEVSTALRGEPITSLPKRAPRRARAYRCEVSSAAGLVRLLAENYIPNGYRFYVSGVIPAHKKASRTDARIIAKYGLAISSSERCRRRQAGEGAIQYLRLGRFFVLLATADAGRFHALASCGVGESVVDPVTGEELAIRAFRRRGLLVGGYLVCERNGHPSVSISPSEYSRLKAELLRRALRESEGRLTARFRTIPYEPYAPIRQQLFRLRAAVNRVRLAAGLRLVPRTAVRTRRKVVPAYSACGDA